MASDAKRNMETWPMFQERDGSNNSRNSGKRRSKILCLGVSYPDLQREWDIRQQQPTKESGERHTCAQTVNSAISSLSPCNGHCAATTDSTTTPSNATKTVLSKDHPTLEWIYQSVFFGRVVTVMDGRDLARCVATELYCEADVYTVSQERGALYRPDRHLSCNFNCARKLIPALQQSFVEAAATTNNNHTPKPCQFDQIILDYFWIPNEWNVNHWKRSFFQTTLPQFYHQGIIKPKGKIFLPFCYHTFREVLVASKQLLPCYDISVLRKDQLHKIALWKGTQYIDARIMQNVLGKQLNQEDVYCTFGPRDVMEAMDDPDIARTTILDAARSYDDFHSIRFLVLEPLIPAARIPPTVSTRRSRTINNNNNKAMRGQFVGKSTRKPVRNGFDAYVPPALATATTVPNNTVAVVTPTTRTKTTTPTSSARSSKVPVLASKTVIWTESVQPNKRRRLGRTKRNVVDSDNRTCGAGSDDKQQQAVPSTFPTSTTMISIAESGNQHYGTPMRTRDDGDETTGTTVAQGYATRYRLRKEQLDAAKGLCCLAGSSSPTSVVTPERDIPIETPIQFSCCVHLESVVDIRGQRQRNS